MLEPDQLAISNISLVISSSTITYIVNCNAMKNLLSI